MNPRIPSPTGPRTAVSLLLTTVVLAATPQGSAGQAPRLPEAGALALADVLPRALAVDPELAAARAGAEAAGHAVQGARAERLPSVAGSADLLRFQDPMVVAPLHGFDIQSPPEFDRTLVQGQLGVEWTAWDGGATGARIARARAGHEAAEARALAVRQSRIAGTVQAYLDVLTTREVAAAHAARRDALEAERDRVERFLAEGSAARVELLRAEAALSAVRADQEAALAALRVAESRLALLLEVPGARVGSAVLRDVVLDGDTPASGATDSVAPGAHPALAAALDRADAARAGLEEAEAAWMPVVRATGALQEYGGATSDFSAEWRTGVRLSWPIFTGGARGAAADRARAAAREADEEVRAVERELRTSADRARAAAAESAARVRSLRAAVEQYDELTRVELLALREGVGVQSDYLRAQAGLFDARAGLASARRRLVMARVALAAAVGELTEAWVRTRTAAGAPVPPVSAAPADDAR